MSDGDAERVGPRIIEEAQPLVEASGFRTYALRGSNVLPKRDPTADEESRMVDHVVYEVEAICGLIRTFAHDAAHDLREFEPRTRAYFKAEALVAAYLLHVRVLDDFFYRDEIDKPHLPRSTDPEFRTYDGRAWLRRPDDVLAHDLVENLDSWLASRPPRPRVLEEVRSRINKSLLHLSWHRLDPEAWMPGHDPNVKRQSWDPTPPYLALRNALEAFLGCVPARLEIELAEPVRSALTWPDTLPEGAAIIE